MSFDCCSTVRSCNSFDEDSVLVAICGLCDGEKNIGWRCIECNIKMCEKCKIIHSNAKGFKSHSILSFNDLDCYVLDAQMKKRIQKLHCRKHPHQNYTLFCKICDCLICDVCVPQSHKLHDVFGLDQFINEKLKTDGMEVSETLPKRFLARSPRIENETLPKRFLANSPSMDNDTKETQFLARSSSINQDTLPKQLLARSLSVIDYSLATVNVELIHRVVTKLPIIHFLKAVTNLSAWVGCIDVDKIQKIKMPIKSRKFCLRFLYNKMNKDIECNDLDQIEGYNATDIETIDDDILFLSKSDNWLKRAFTDAYGQKKVCNIHNFDPLVPICLHIDKNTEWLWVGLKEKGKSELSVCSIRRIIAISINTWKTEKSFEFTTSGRRLFTSPFRIRDIAGQICILDRTSQKAGRIISVNSLGHQMWDYSDPQDTNVDVKPFFPTAIATTDSEIFVIDAANRGIHILNTAGNIIAFRSMSEIGIDRPYSLDIDPDGRFWVGTACDNRNNVDQTANICVIKMSIQ